jgi:transcriptional regulator with XRE-family HTH domain
MADQTQKCEAQELFARNMKRLRKERKLTQEALSERAGLNPNYINAVEKGRKNISIRNIDLIAQALGVSMAELVTDADTAGEPAGRWAKISSLGT